VGGFYWYYVQDAQTAIAVEQTNLDAMKLEINKGLTTARQLPEFRRQVGDLQVRLATLRAVLPEEKDVSDLLRRLQTLATQSNLQIKGFKPAAIVTKQTHAEWPITLELDGTYHNLGVFFDRVSRFPRIINVSGVTIKGKEKPQPGSTVTAACVATTYVWIEAPAKPLAGAPAVPARKVS
jgi:type IV pilus assembly protein PilO